MREEGGQARDCWHQHEDKTTLCSNRGQWGNWVSGEKGEKKNVSVGWKGCPRQPSVSAEWPLELPYPIPNSPPSLLHLHLHPSPWNSNLWAPPSGFNRLPWCSRLPPGASPRAHTLTGHNLPGRTLLTGIMVHPSDASILGNSARSWNAVSTAKPRSSGRFWSAWKRAGATERQISWWLGMSSTHRSW